MITKNAKVPQNKNYFYKILLLIAFITGFIFTSNISAQQEEQEIINYFQMEPLDDSLFIQIQMEIFIDPPDPKAEIIVDLREVTNQTVSIGGVLYPYLAFTPETRARIFTYPFKIDLSKGVTFSSVFTDVIDKIKLKKIVAPPTKYQISSTMNYINPFFQLLGGERFGFAIHRDIGVSIGTGTPYSGPLETSMILASFHLIGARVGFFTKLDEIFRVSKTDNIRNNLYVFYGVEVGYVIPFGNFLEISYTANLDDPGKVKSFEDIYQAVYDGNYETYEDKMAALDNEQPFVLRDSYLNWEFRYPVSILGSTRGKVYVAQYLDEWHTGFMGREMSLAGSTFDFRIDAMVGSKTRNNQVAIDLIVSKIFDMWASSAMAFGPSLVLTTLDDGSFGAAQVFANFRFKLGTSL